MPKSKPPVLADPGLSGLSEEELLLIYAALDSLREQKLIEWAKRNPGHTIFVAQEGEALTDDLAIDIGRTSDLCKKIFGEGLARHTDILFAENHRLKQAARAARRQKADEEP